MVGTERIDLREEEKLRLSYFKRMSSETAEYAKILIQNYGNLRKALESFDNDPNYQDQSRKISELIKVEEHLSNYKINGQPKSLLELIDKFEPEREDTVIIDKSELEKRLNKSEE
jgi:hypothetical protein